MKTSSFWWISLALLKYRRFKKLGIFSFKMPRLRNVRYFFSFGMVFKGILPWSSVWLSRIAVTYLSAHRMRDTIFEESLLAWSVWADKRAPLFLRGSDLSSSCSQMGSSVRRLIDWIMKLLYFFGPVQQVSTMSFADNSGWSSGRSWARPIKAMTSGGMFIGRMCW